MLKHTVTTDRHLGAGTQCARAMGSIAAGCLVVLASASAAAQNAAGTEVSVSGAPATETTGVTQSSSEAPAGNLAIDTPLEALRERAIVASTIETRGSSVRTGYAATIVSRPVAEVLAAIHDVNHYRDFIPQFEQSQELGHGASYQDLFVRIEIAHFAHLWARLRYRDVQQPHGAIEINGHSLQGNARMDIRWRATPMQGGLTTVLEFWSLVVPELPIPLPVSLIEREQQSAAQRGVTAVRTRVEAQDVRLSSVITTAPAGSSTVP